VLPGTAPDGVTTIGDRLFPYVGNTGYDVGSYEVSYDYDPDDVVMTGAVAITATATADLDSLSLDSAMASVESVTVDGVEAPFDTGGEKLLIEPTRRINDGASFVVKARFTVDRSTTPLSPLTDPADPVGIRPWVTWDDGFALMGQPDRAHVFFPMNDHPSDKATVTVHVTAPDTLVVAANGTETGRIPLDDSRATTTFATRDPIATEVFQVAVGDFALMQRDADGVSLLSWVPSGSEREMDRYVDLVPRHVRWMTDQVGAFPYERYGVLVLPRDYQGVALETATMSTYGTLSGSVQEIDDLMLHETAHQWFGDAVSPASWDDMWLSEGHASFYGMLYQMEQGHADLDDTFRRAYEYDVENRPVTGPPTQLRDRRDVLGSTNAPGVALLFALRERVGASVFQEIERTFVEEHLHGSATTADYVEVASRLSGEPLNAFFDEWLTSEHTPEMPGHPEWGAAGSR